jgi:hypothetical protein
VKKQRSDRVDVLRIDNFDLFKFYTGSRGVRVLVRVSAFEEEKRRE